MAALGGEVSSLPQPGDHWLGPNAAGLGDFWDPAAGTLADQGRTGGAAKGCLFLHGDYGRNDSGVVEEGSCEEQGVVVCPRYGADPTPLRARTQERGETGFGEVKAASRLLFSPS